MQAWIIYIQRELFNLETHKAQFKNYIIIFELTEKWNHNTCNLLPS